MKKVLILSFLFNLQCLFAGDDQENLSILQFSPLFGQKINYNKKENDLMTYFMFNQHETSSRNVSRASDVSDLSRCSSVGLDLSNLRVTSPNETSRSELKNGLKPESRYASPIKGSCESNCLTKFSPELKEIVSPTRGKSIALPFVAKPDTTKSLRLLSFFNENAPITEQNVVSSSIKGQKKRNRSDSFDDEYDRKLSKH